MGTEHPRVTVVNDNPDFLELMQDILQDATYPTILVDGDRENALELIKASQPQVLVIDLRMGSEKLHGLDIIREVRAAPELRDVPTLVCTADRWALEKVETELRSFERVGVLSKPFSIAELYRSIDALL